MRKGKISLGIATALLSTLILSGCQDKTATADSGDTPSEVQADTQTEPQEQESAPEEEQAYTVTFYDTDGTTVLSE